MNWSSFEPETCQQNSPIARGKFQRLSGFTTDLFLGLVRVKVTGKSSSVSRPRGLVWCPLVSSDERTHDCSSSSDSAFFAFIINIVFLLEMVLYGVGVFPVGVSPAVGFLPSCGTEGLGAG